MNSLLSFAFPFVLCCLLLHPESAPDQRAVLSPVENETGGGLFDSDEILQIKITGKVRTLFNDRGDNAPYHPMVLSYKGADSNEVSINVRAKTRGNFRRKKENCSYPPILLNFTRKTAQPSLFDQQDKLKLVTPCVNDQHVIREYLVYKMYNLITPKSYRARLARVTFVDSGKNKEASFYSMLLEEDEQMAKRNGAKIFDIKNTPGENTEIETFLKMAVFQYMIGNTDWSVPYLHNIRLLSFDPATIPSVVPYDFDHAGIVDAPYALPPEQLQLSSTKERRYRGYCITDMKTFDEVIATYNRVKEDVYKLFTTNTLLDARYVKATTRFLDDFYETINNPKRLKEAFSYPCNNTATNYIIRGYGE